MRNLKKILALVLALMMVVSVMVFASAADFDGYNDVDEIDSDYAEAVEVLTNMGVFRGYDGGFQPKKNVERSQVAAIVYRILTADVNDKNVGLYENYNYFTDVTEANWFAGYVNYAANGKYVVGVGEDRFDPDGNVTGYQLLVIMLRALGYGKNGEFEGTSEWTIRAATTAEELGITDGLKADLSNELTREEVAYILFKAIQVDKVEYTSAFGYQNKPNETTIGYDEFGLERIQGAITGNEYADLDGSAPLAEGETRLAGRIIDASTTLEDIGESRYAYVIDSTVLAMNDTGLNDVFETGAATVVTKANTGMDLDGAEKFLNFEGGDSYTASDYRIRYIISASALNVETEAQENLYKFVNDGDFVDYPAAEGTGTVRVYEKSISTKETLSRLDMENIEAIFDYADLEDDTILLGEVYVGTQSNDDISDSISYNEFVNRYIDVKESTVNVSETENGEWLKVIDNNGDGDAEYIFKTEFAMSMISEITNKGVHYFVPLFAGEPDFEAVRVDEADIVTSDELAEGDIVIYTRIDGVYYVDIANMVTETVDKGGVDKREETITCGDTVYGQSGIGYANLMDAEIAMADTQVAYDLYLDHFGYVRLYTESAFNNGFVLLTDGYYYTNNRTSEYQATIYDVDSSELVDVDVAAGKGATAASNFIDTDEGGDNGDKGTWKRLLEAGQVYFNDTEASDPYITNIAAADVADGVYTLTEVQNASNRVNYYAQELAVARNSLSARTLDGSVCDVQTTTGTVYYLVVKGAGNTVSEILSWTGYANTPENAAFGTDVVGYAVTHNTARDYAVADVVVFETNQHDPYDLHFVYESNGLDEVVTIGYNGDAYVSDLEVDVRDNETYTLIDFYNISSNGYADLIADDDFAAEGIYAGTADVVSGVDYRDYVLMRAANNTSDSEISFRVNDVPSFIVTRTANGKFYDVAVQDEDFHNGDELIVVTNASGDVEYVINVTQSRFDYNGNGILERREIVPAIDELYDEIWAAHNRIVPVTVTFYGEPATKDGTTTVSYTTAAADGTGVEVSGDVKKVVLYENGVQVDLEDVGLETSTTTYTLVVTGTDDEVYNYTLVQNGISDDTNLYSADDTDFDTPVGTAASTVVVVNDLKATQTTNFMKQYMANETMGSKIISWTFYDGYGVEADETNTTLINGYYAIVVVEAENGDRVSYTIQLGSTSIDKDVLADSLANSITDKDDADQIASVIDAMGDSSIWAGSAASALKKAGVSEMRIVEGLMNAYTAPGDNDRIISEIISGLTDSKPEDVAEAYVAWLVAHKETTGNVTNGGKFDLTQGVGDTYTLTLASDIATNLPSNTGLLALLQAYQSEVTNIAINWVGSDNLPGSTPNFTWTDTSDLNNQLVKDIGNLMSGNVSSLSWTVILGDTAYVINFVKGA